MNLRTIAAQAFQSKAPDWNVLAAARTPDALNKPTVVVWLGRLTRANAGAGQLVTAAIEVWLLPAQTDVKPEALEDACDTMLTEALPLIEAAPALTWSEATRGALDGQWHGWHITLTALQTINTE